MVTLTAVPDTGWAFANWTGGLTGSINPQSLTIDGNTTVTATFTLIPPNCYTLTLSHTGQGSDPTASPVNSTGCSTGQYIAGQVVNLSGAVADSGWQISGWTGTSNNSSTASTNSLTMPASAQAAGVIYTQNMFPISVGSTWKYLDNGSDQGTVWSGTAFDDSTWASGPAELGYGDGGEATVVNCGPSRPACNSNNYVTTYFRYTFNVPDRSLYSGLNLRLLRDDGAVVIERHRDLANQHANGCGDL